MFTRMGMEPPLVSGAQAGARGKSCRCSVGTDLPGVENEPFGFIPSGKPQGLFFFFGGGGVRLPFSFSADRPARRYFTPYNAQATVHLYASWLGGTSVTVGWTGWTWLGSEKAPAMRLAQQGQSGWGRRHRPVLRVGHDSRTCWFCSCFQVRGNIRRRNRPFFAGRRFVGIVCKPHMSFDQALDCDGFGFQESFWGLLLPVTVHGRVSDIWRAYLTQKLLWDADWPDFSGGLVCGTGLCSLLSCMGTSSAGFPPFSSGFGKPLFAGEVCRGARFKVQSSRSEVGQVVSFVPPHVVHDRVAHDYLKDFQSEGDLQPGYPVSDRSSFAMECPKCLVVITGPG